MKKITLIIAALFISSFSVVQAQNDEKAIKQVIQSAYIDGIHNLGNIADIEKGFHPGFNLLIKNKQEQMVKYPIYNWIESVKVRKAENPNGPEEKTTVEFIEIDITGDAGMAKIDLFRAGKRIYTDYLFLYKFDEDWQIVSKVYHGY
jgi:hypothetical protein